MEVSGSMLREVPASMLGGGGTECILMKGAASMLRGSLLVG